MEGIRGRRHIRGSLPEHCPVQEARRQARSAGRSERLCSSAEGRGCVLIPFVSSECLPLVSGIGIDIAGGQPPSKAQMFKLAMSSKFRDGAKKVVVELQNAGIDLSSKVSYRISSLILYHDLVRSAPHLQEAMQELTDFSRWSKK